MKACSQASPETEDTRLWLASTPETQMHEVEWFWLLRYAGVRPRQLEWTWLHEGYLPEDE